MLDVLGSVLGVLTLAVGAIGGALFANWTLFLSPDMFKLDRKSVV